MTVDPQAWPRDTAVGKTLERTAAAMRERSGPNLQAIRIHGHGVGCQRVTWEYWLTPEQRPAGAKEEDYPCTCGLEAWLNLLKPKPTEIVAKAVGTRKAIGR